MTEENKENCMDKENVEKIEELLDDSLDTLSDKKRYSKTMNSIIKDCAKSMGIEPSVLKKVKNYYHYKGVNWSDKNPLQKNSEIKEKDKVAPIFIKLKEVVDNLRAVGDENFLKEYLDAMNQCGIHISIDFEESGYDDEKISTIKTVLDSASKLQTNVDTLAEELKENKSSEAEKLNFTPKSQFCGVLGILDKINEGKNVDDKIQDTFTEITMLNNAYTYLSAKNDENKESE